MTQPFIVTFAAVLSLSTTLVSTARAQDKEKSAGLSAEAPLAQTAGAEERELLVGVWPTDIPRISLDLDDATLDEAIEEIADQADWNLALTVAEGLDDSLTLRVKDVPATQALRLVLERGNLQARFNKGMLVVERPESVTAEPSRNQRNKQNKRNRHTKDVEVTMQQDDGSVQIRSGDERTNVGGDVRVEANEVVEGDAVAIGGSVTILGRVEGEAVAIGGSVILEPGAVVEGKATAIGGEVIVPEGAEVYDDRVSIGSGSLGGIIQALARHDKPVAVGGLLFSIIATLLRSLTFLVLALLLVSFIPERVNKVGSFLRQRPGHSALAGLAVMLGIVPLCILLAVTVIGLVLVPVVMLLLAIAMVLGMTALCQWLGYRIPILSNKGPIAAVLVGIGLLTLVDLLPLFGTPVVMLVSFVTAGAVLLSRFGKLEAQPTPPPNVL